MYDQVGCQQSICCVSEGMFDFDHLIFIIHNQQFWGVCVRQLDNQNVLN